jgi:hypothetical protein
VRNIYKYYASYKLLIEASATRQQALKAAAGAASAPKR